MLSTEDELIGTAVAAQILGVAMVTITRWVAEGAISSAGKLPGKNGAFLFSRSEVESLAAARSRSAAVGVSQ